MIYRTNLFGFYRASPKKKPNINPKQIPKGPTQKYSQKTKNKKNKKNQPKPNMNTRPPQSSNGKAKT